MVLTFTKTRFEDIPDAIANAIQSFTKREVIIDDTSLTAQQQQKVSDYLIQEGYKQV